MASVIGGRTALSVRRCIAQAFGAFGDHWQWLLIFNGAYSLMDVGLAWSEKHESAGSLGLAAPYLSTMAAVAYVAAMVVISSRIATGQPLDRAAGRAFWRFLPRFLRFVLFILAPLLVVGVAVYAGLMASAGEGPADRLAMGIIGIVFWPLFSAFAFSSWCLLDGEGVRASLRRSWQLVEGNYVGVLVLSSPFVLEMTLTGYTTATGKGEYLFDWLDNTVLYPLSTLALAFAYATLRPSSEAEHAPAG